MKINSLLYVYAATMIFVAFFLPLTQDETYYMFWGLEPSFGYFDHPPMVGFFSKLAHTFNISSTSFGSRLPFLISTLILLQFSYFILKDYLKSSQKALQGLTFLGFTLPILTSSFVINPDNPLFLFWVLSLYFLQKISKKNSYSNWVFLGICCGFGLLSKYTFVLMAPVIFFTILMRYRLKNFPIKKFLLCLFIAIGIFSPNFLWNMNNNFISYKFQLGHGFQNLAEPTLSSAILPKPQEEDPSYNLLKQSYASGVLLSPAHFYKIQSTLTSTPPNTPQNSDMEIKQTSRKPKSIQKRIEYVCFYIIQILLLLGVLWVPLLLNRPKSKISFRKEDLPFLLSTLVPTIFFLVVSSQKYVEANWPSMAVFGFTALLFKKGFHFDSNKMSTKWACLSHSLLIILLTTHSLKPFLFFENDRIIKETYGYKESAEFLDSHFKNDVFFADRYQTISSLLFYAPHLHLSQWPELKRPSHFLISQKHQDVLKKLNHSKKFHLLQESSSIPFFFGYFPTQYRTLRVCNHKVEILEVQEEEDKCKLLKEWKLISYKTS
jgi:4-amino-4-deoxy-L-arabinose transferase-like glycosyltransferase